MPVAIDLGVILAAILALIVAYGFLYVYRGTFKPLLVAVAKILNSIRLPGIFGGGHLLGFLASWVASAADAIDHALARAVLDAEGGIIALWHGLAKQATWLGNLLGDFAETVETRFRSFALGTIPRQLGNLRAQLAHKLAQVVAAVAAAEATFEAEVARLGRGIDRTGSRLTKALRGIEAALAARVRAVEHAIAGIDGTLRGVGRDLSRAGGRLRRIERTLTPAGIAGIVGAAIVSQLGLGWIKKPCAKNTAEKFCNVHPDVLEGLFAGLVALFATFSLVEFTKYLQPIVGELGGEVTHFWRAEIAGQSRDRAVGSARLTRA